MELANDVNEHMPEYVVQRVAEALNERELPVKNRRILLLGMAYKANTGDARETPSTPIAQGLSALGAQVVAGDPHVENRFLPNGVTSVELTEDELAKADAVVLLVEHAEFDLDLISASGAYVLDTRHCLKGATVEYL